MKRKIIKAVLILVCIPLFADLNDQLIQAATDDNQEQVLLLIESGADINTTDENGATALAWAVQNGNPELVQILIQKSINLDTSEFNTGFTPLIRAIGNGYTEIAELLISAGADVELKDNYKGQTPLSWAVHLNNETIAELLILKSDSIDEEDMHGSTALSYAAAYASPEIVRKLI